MIAGLFLCYLLVACESRHIQHRSANESDAEDLEGIDSTDLVVKVADNEVGRFLNNSRSKFIEALKNLSNYLPINVEYALMKECDIIHNNRVFYARVPLIISAALIVLGIIFGYFGECVSGDSLITRLIKGDQVLDTLANLITKLITSQVH